VFITRAVAAAEIMVPVAKAVVVMEITGSGDPALTVWAVEEGVELVILVGTEEKVL